LLRLGRYVRVGIARPTVHKVARGRVPFVRRVSPASSVLWTRPTPAHRPRDFAYAYTRGAVEMRRPHGVTAPPLSDMLRAFTLRARSHRHRLRCSRMGLPHLSAGSSTTARHKRIDRFGPAGSHLPPPHAQGATLLARPHGGAVGFALRVAVALRGQGSLTPAEVVRLPALPPSSTLTGYFGNALSANK